MFSTRFSTSLGNPFVGVERRQGVAWVTLDRPPRHAINPVMAHGLTHTVQALLEDDRTTAVVLTGSARCFSAGADLPFFLRQLVSGDIRPIEQFSVRMHQLCDLIAAAEKPVVAAIRGSALGAGLEIALACDQIIAGRSATLGLPETGLGICPGCGGTQRLPWRVGEGIAKWLIYTGHLLSGRDAMQLGVADRCVADSEVELAAGVAVQSALEGANGLLSPQPLPEAYRQLAETFERHSVSQLLDPDSAEARIACEDPRCRRALDQLRRRPLGALLLAERLMDLGRELPRAEALRLEVDAQREMFVGAEVMALMQMAASASRPPVTNPVHATPVHPTPTKGEQQDP